MTANAKAWELRAKMFDLLGEFKDFAAAVAQKNKGDDPAMEAAGQADGFACELAALHGKITGPSPAYDLFTDAARDTKDQAFRFRIAGGIAEDFAVKLKALREKAGLSGADLAEKAGTTRQTIYNLEAGTYRPTWDVVQALAAALGVSTEVFRDK